MISISNLSKHYGDQTLFEGVSLQFNRGERYGIVGANGSGKSTLLRILTGEGSASDGDIAIPKRARLGVLRQDHFQYEDERILDVVMMGNASLWQAMLCARYTGMASRWCCNASPSPATLPCPKIANMPANRRWRSPSVSMCCCVR
jgi:ATPase subunit of ABC transporter with duplicated ATPase domains